VTLRPVEVARFHARVQRAGADACWPWQGKRRNGYGRMFANGKMLSAHRVSWALANGSIPDGMKVLHRCDNPPCVNPNHLFVGTQGDNMRDCAAKRRLSLQQHPERTQGERHPMAKLTADVVREIRARKGSASTYALAREFGVCQATIHQIHVGKIWKESASGY
jgi:hypothetical protein